MVTRESGDHAIISNDRGLKDGASSLFLKRARRLEVMGVVYVILDSNTSALNMPISRLEGGGDSLTIHTTWKLLSTQVMNHAAFPFNNNSNWDFYQLSAGDEDIPIMVNDLKAK